MKTFIVYMTIIALAAAAALVEPDTKSISTTIIDVIEDIRTQMPCGFPTVGIPPVAPFKLYHRKIQFEREALHINGAIDNFRLDGLNNFEIVEMDVNSILSKVNFHFIFQRINMETNYDLAIMLKKTDTTLDLVGNGAAKIAFKDLHIWGSIQYSLDMMSGQMSLKSLQLRTNIGAVESEIEGMVGASISNDALAEAITQLVNENEDMISDTIESVALPMFNNVLDGMNLYDVLANRAAGADERMQCLPLEF